MNSPLTSYQPECFCLQWKEEKVWEKKISYRINKTKNKRRLKVVNFRLLSMYLSGSTCQPFDWQTPTVRRSGTMWKGTKWSLPPLFTTLLKNSLGFPDLSFFPVHKSSFEKNWLLIWFLHICALDDFCESIPSIVLVYLNIMLIMSYCGTSLDIYIAKTLELGGRYSLEDVFASPTAFWGITFDSQFLWIWLTFVTFKFRIVNNTMAYIPVVNVR